MVREALNRGGVWFLLSAWTLVSLGVVVIFVGYHSIPEYVVLYRPPWDDALTMSPKSVLSVGRVPLMGVGQLGAATTMALVSRDSASWKRFWYWLGLVAGVKTLFECVGLLVPHGSLIGQALTLSTFAAVGLFALSALWWWRRGDLRAHPPITSGPRIRLLAWLALWVVFAFSPLLCA